MFFNRPKSGYKRDKLNAVTPGLILPKSHNNFDIKLTLTSDYDASTDFESTDISPTS